MSWIYLFLLGVLKVKYRMSYRNPNGFDCNQAMSSFESVGGLESAVWKWYSTEVTPLLSKWDHQFLVLANTFFASYSVVKGRILAFLRRKKAMSFIIIVKCNKVHLLQDDTYLTLDQNNLVTTSCDFDLVSKKLHIWFY